MSPSAHPETNLPEQPIQHLTAPFKRFLHIEAAGGVVLLVATIVALGLANSPWSEWYLAIWESEFSIGFAPMSHSLRHWISDGLMAVFFFVIGLEVKRELVLGELRDLRKAALPIAAAIGGMVVPAGIYLSLQLGEPGERGWGIPMATDIAFVVGCMAVLGSRVPPGLRILLLSLAIADDIGAILVIAIGYTQSLNLTALSLALVGLAGILGFSWLGVRSIGLYLALGVGIWLAFHESGVHATLAGVILGLMTPSRSWVSAGRLQRSIQLVDGFLHGEEWRSTAERRAMLQQVARAAREAMSPLERHENALHPWMSFAIVPLFALANAGVAVELGDLGSPIALAAALGLVVGKPLGIVAVSWLAVRIGIASLPQGVTWPILAAGGLLAGIGFTMALFIAGLALESPHLEAAKVGVLLGSGISALFGMGLLLVLLPKAAPSAGD
jgi:NhaA family Na+:H+ antiporter